MFLIYVILPAAPGPGLTHPVTEMSTRRRKTIVLGSRARPVRRADSLAAICEPIVWTMWEPRRLTTPWASTACYGFTFFVHVLSGAVSTQPRGWLGRVGDASYLAEHCNYDTCFCHIPGCLWRQARTHVRRDKDKPGRRIIQRNCGNYIYHFKRTSYRNYVHRVCIFWISHMTKYVSSTCFLRVRNQGLECC
jgi:hypothetical protein